MRSEYVGGYTAKTEFCPFFGSTVGTTCPNGNNTYDDCGRTIFVVEDDLATKIVHSISNF